MHAHDAVDGQHNHISDLHLRHTSLYDAKHSPGGCWRRAYKTVKTSWLGYGRYPTSLRVLGDSLRQPRLRRETLALPLSLPLRNAQHYPRQNTRVQGGLQNREKDRPAATTSLHTYLSLVMGHALNSKMIVASIASNCLAWPKTPRNNGPARSILDP